MAHNVTTVCTMKWWRSGIARCVYHCAPVPLQSRPCSATKHQTATTPTFSVCYGLVQTDLESVDTTIPSVQICLATSFYYVPILVCARNGTCFVLHEGDRYEWRNWQELERCSVFFCRYMACVKKCLYERS